MKILSYNMAKRPVAWTDVMASGADVALLQEIANPNGIEGYVRVDGEPWHNEVKHHEHVWRNAVAALTEDVQIRWFKPHIAEVTPAHGAPMIVMSLYATWQRPNPVTGSSWIYADASAHRLISDMSAFIGSTRGHRIIAAGDLNILYGYGEHGDAYWKGRYQSIFDRMEALGMTFVGPQYPNGRQADPWPDELPRDSANVPTYHTVRSSPAGATRQLDYVFASESIADRITVRALNGIEEWGKSDHCRIVIDLAP